MKQNMALHCHDYSQWCSQDFFNYMDVRGSEHFLVGSPWRATGTLKNSNIASAKAASKFFAIFHAGTNKNSWCERRRCERNFCRFC